MFLSSNASSERARAIVAALLVSAMVCVKDCWPEEGPSGGLTDGYEQLNKNSEERLKAMLHTEHSGLTRKMTTSVVHVRAYDKDLSETSNSGRLQQEENGLFGLQNVDPNHIPLNDNLVKKGQVGAVGMDEGAIPIGQGSGFFISDDGYCVTNYRVVENGVSYSVTTHQGVESEARLVGYDIRTDIAVLKVDTDAKVAFVSFANEENSKIGDSVTAVGNPLGLGSDVIQGAISSLSRNTGAGPDGDFMQINAVLAKGYSGGPTFNGNAEVVGVNSIVFSTSAPDMQVSFAIPGSTAKHVVNRILRVGANNSGWISVKAQPVTTDVRDSLGLNEAAGALIYEVKVDGPASNSRLKIGDVVLAVDGKKVQNPQDLSNKILSSPTGASLILKIWRNGTEMSVTVDGSTHAEGIQKARNSSASESLVNGHMQPDAASDSEKISNARETVHSLSAHSTITNRRAFDLGINVVPNDVSAGVVIMDVRPGSSAAKHGIIPGDIILDINEQPVQSDAELISLIMAASKKGRKAILAKMQDYRGINYIAVPIN